MGFSCGIIGLPNVGKSTLFNALTLSHVPAENYPFCTKDKNIGVVTVPDLRLKQLEKLVPKERKIVPTTIEFVDIAGLVKGASLGEGLGNQFLGYVAEVDAIAHVVRCFQRSDVIHIYEAVDPMRDIEIVNTELILRDLDLLQKWFHRYEKGAKTGSDKKLKETVAVVEKLIEVLQKGISIREVSLMEEEVENIKGLHLGTLTSKPLFYVANISESDLKNPSSLVQNLTMWCSDRKVHLVQIASRIEEELSELSEEERREFMKELDLSASALVQVIQSGYEVLGLITFFTIVGKELRAWTLRKGTSAIRAAGKIHSDFEKGFITAETVSFTDFIACGGEHTAREQGKLRLEGKDYLVQDGDIITFRFSHA